MDYKSREQTVSYFLLWVSAEQVVAEFPTVPQLWLEVVEPTHHTTKDKMMHLGSTEHGDWEWVAFPGSCHHFESRAEAWGVGPVRHPTYSISAPWAATYKGSALLSTDSAADPSFPKLDSAGWALDPWQPVSYYPKEDLPPRNKYLIHQGKPAPFPRTQRPVGRLPGTSRCHVLAPYKCSRLCKEVATFFLFQSVSMTIYENKPPGQLGETGPFILVRHRQNTTGRGNGLKVLFPLLRSC